MCLNVKVMYYTQTNTNHTFTVTYHIWLILYKRNIKYSLGKSFPPKMDFTYVNRIFNILVIFGKEIADIKIFWFYVRHYNFTHAHDRTRLTSQKVHAWSTR